MERSGDEGFCGLPHHLPEHDAFSMPPVSSPVVGGNLFGPDSRLSISGANSIGVGFQTDCDRRSLWRNRTGSNVMSSTKLPGASVDTEASLRRTVSPPVSSSPPGRSTERYHSPGTTGRVRLPSSRSLPSADRDGHQRQNQYSMVAAAVAATTMKRNSTANVNEGVLSAGAGTPLHFSEQPSQPLSETGAEHRPVMAQSLKSYGSVLGFASRNSSSVMSAKDRALLHEKLQRTSMQTFNSDSLRCVPRDGFSRASSIASSAVSRVPTSSSLGARSERSGFSGDIPVAPVQSIRQARSRRCSSIVSGEESLTKRMSILSGPQPQREASLRVPGQRPISPRHEGKPVLAEDDRFKLRSPSQSVGRSSYTSRTSTSSPRNSCLPPGLGGPGFVHVASLKTKRFACWRAMLQPLWNLRKKISPHCRWLIRHNIFQAIMLASLLSALFLPDIWVVADRPNNHDLDVLLTFVLILFLAEFVLQSIGMTRTYWGSFIFYMDCIGAMSLLFDLSYVPLMEVLGGGEDVSNNVIIMRAARIAKLGARAGRFTKLVKLLRFLPGMSIESRDAEQVQRKGKFVRFLPQMKLDATDPGTAKVISARLLTALSTRVSCLIIVMVIVLPVFSFWSYPEQDWSMKAWANIIEEQGLAHPDRFETQLRDFQAFYKSLNYFPYRILVRVPGLQTTRYLSGGAPRRKGNKNTIWSSNKHVGVEFNFTTVSQIDAVMSMALIIAVMMMMVFFSLRISNSVSRLVLAPLEKLLKQVKQAAATIFKSVTDMADLMKEDRDCPDAASRHNTEEASVQGFESETQLLEKVVEKLAMLGYLFMQKGLDQETLAGLSENDRGIFNQYQGGAGNGLSQRHSEISELEVLDNTAMLLAQREIIQTAGLSLDQIDSFAFNPLEVDKARCHAASMFFLGPHNHGVGFDPMVMNDFLTAVEESYNNLAYHNWFHAVDVTHFVYRMLQVLCTEAYLGGSERYAVLASAICHDIGHPGLTNMFLVETEHELAMRYNDKSPLENMHCAKTFEVVGQPRFNIFSTLSRNEFVDTRKCCIDAILHTDTSQHFCMIKEVQLLYEVNSELFVESRDSFCVEPQDFPTREVVECFREVETRSLFRKLVLHVADISNPAKPFRICRVWAWKCLEEMFAQGDTEKELGVPVQSLNDRDKVNRPYSQVGFIEFLVAPLAFAMVKVLPPFEVCVGQLVDNLKRWQEMWIADTKPAPTQEERKALDVRIRSLEKKFIEGV